MGCNCNKKQENKPVGTSCFTPTDYCLKKNNYLSEFKTEKDKELACKNLGIESNLNDYNIISSDDSISIDKHKQKMLDGSVVNIVDLHMKQATPDANVANHNIIEITKDNMFKYIEGLSNTLRNELDNSTDKNYYLLIDDEYDEYFITKEVSDFIYHDCTADRSHGRIVGFKPKNTNSNVWTKSSILYVGGYVPFGSYIPNEKYSLSETGYIPNRKSINKLITKDRSGVTKEDTCPPSIGYMHNDFHEFILGPGDKWYYID